MNIQEIVKILTNSGIEPNEASAEVKILIEHFCNYGIKDIIMGHPLDYEKLEIVKEKAELRAQTKQPVQYITGTAYFMGNKYKVTPDVLIPRDETELTVRHAIDILKKNGLKKVLETGTGSGCIACTIAQLTDCSVTACDISNEALKIAQINAVNLGVRNIRFIQSDLFSKIPDEECFDMIISNPPYIPKGTPLQKEVMFEPQIALFTNDVSGTEYHKKIIKEGNSRLNKGGYIVFEIGINQSDIVKKYFTDNGYADIIILKDLAGIDRVISARKQK